MFGQVLTWQDPQMAALGSAGTLVDLLGENGFILVSSVLLAVGLQLLEQQQQQQQQQHHNNESVTTTVHKWGM